MKFRYLLSLLFFCAALLSLSSCVSRPPQANNWPTDIPSRDYFVAQYDADPENKKGQDLDEYLLWVIRFYKGWELYRNGWTKVTEDSLHGVTDPARASEIRTKMGLIGQGIAGEWSKNKKDRRILLRHVVVWGNALVESIKRDQELPLINRVLADVNALLDGQLDLDEVKADRYFSRDGDDTFL